MVIRGGAPLRVNLGGGGTDVAPFCEEQGGATIGSIINKYVCCPIVPREDDQIVVHPLDFDTIVKYNIGENYVHDGKLDLVAAALNAMGIDQGCEVYLWCGALPGSDLGTSSTVMVAMLTAMVRWRGVMMDAYALADLAYQVERPNSKIDGGYQDQYTATFRGLNLIESHGRNNAVVNPLCIRRDITHKLQHSLLLCRIGKIHVSVNTIKDQVQNYKKKDAFEVIYEAKALAYALKGELLRRNLHSLGKFLDYGRQSRKCMGSKITNPQIDQSYDGAPKAGALGGKLLGAGGGGYLLIYCPYNVRHRVTARMERAGGQLADWNSKLWGAQSWVTNESGWQYDQVKVHMPNDEY